MITRISIRNFKAFREAEVNLSSLNLFTGLNGMGKSTFIQSLLLLRQSNIFFFPKLQGLNLKGEIIDLGKGKDVYNIHGDDYLSFEIDFNYENLINLSYKYEAEDDILDVAHAIDIPMNFNNIPSLFNNNFKYLKAERIAPEHYYKANLTAIKQKKFLGYKGENTPLYIAMNKLELVTLEKVRHKEAKANNLISNIDAWLNEIAPGTHVMSTYYNELDIVKMGFRFEHGNDFTPEFSPVNVGFGITYLLPVITAILTAKEGDLIIVENPEAHLHPQGQAKMGELLARVASEGVQVIIESHSDHLFNGIRVAIKNQLIFTDDVSIFYFDREQNSEEHTTIIRQPYIDQHGRVSERFEGFFDEYSKQLDELL